MSFYLTLNFLVYLDLFSVSVLKLMPAPAEYATNTVSSKLKQKYEKLAIVFHVLKTTQNLVISRC